MLSPGVNYMEEKPRVIVKIYKERRLYFFKCEKCGNPRAQSFHRRRVKGALCRNCRGGRNRIPENQMSFLGIKFGNSLGQQ